MQLSRHAKNFGAIGLLVTGLTPALAQSSTDEAAARAKAQEQLRQKMAELDTQVPGARQTAAPAVTASGKLSAAAQAAAEAEMSRKLAELNNQPAPVSANLTPVKPTVVVPPPAAPVKVIPAPPAPVQTAAAAVAAPVQASSNDNLDAARQQMREKMAELSTPVAPVTPAAPAVIEASPAPVVAAPVVTPAAAPVAAPVVVPVAQPAPVATPTANIDISAAQEAMRQKMAEMQTPEPVAMPAAPAVPAAPTAPAVVTAPTASAPPATEAVDTAKLAAAQAQVESEMATAKPTQPGAPVFAPAPATSVTGRATAEKEALKVADQKTDTTVTPSASTLMAAPPAAVSAGKEARLQGLLQLYKADKISPEQYHTERAKILAEP